MAISVVESLIKSLQDSPEDWDADTEHISHKKSGIIIDLCAGIRGEDCLSSSTKVEMSW